MKFTKMHGLGNDYIFINTVEQHVEDPSSLARAISDRHTGVGGDGLILIQPSERADVRMKMYNADGSRAQMCGNGIRCVARYAIEHGLAAGPRLRIDTDDGVKSVSCKLEGGIIASVCVDMGKPSLDPAALPSTLPGDRIVEYSLRLGKHEYTITCVSIGNPHAVVFVSDLEPVKLEVLGPQIENAPEFPQRINTHFVRVDAADHVTIRTWERGSGATRACGTGACAVCVAGVVTHRTERIITAALPGGALQIEWADDDHVYMTGPAVEVFTGDWPVPEPTRHNSQNVPGKPLSEPRP
ncbi:MAG: diaminopimelate epimerase [Planctomycetes bacterium]|nr:diaminopimelate epimerase [Planctomycetota bacterium]